jgi:hypothetical protein
MSKPRYATIEDAQAHGSICGGCQITGAESVLSICAGCKSAHYCVRPSHFNPVLKQGREFFFILEPGLPAQGLGLPQGMPISNRDVETAGILICCCVINRHCARLLNPIHTSGNLNLVLDWISSYSISGKSIMAPFSAGHVSMPLIFDAIPNAAKRIYYLLYWRQTAQREGEEKMPGR